MKSVLTQKRLKELFHYNPETGFFTIRATGRIAGSNDGRGYVRLRIDGANYRGHRLAFLYMEGYMPEHQVDHKKGIKHDNRWSEIRHSSPSCNAQNRKIKSTNISGVTGVSWSKRQNSWISKITIQRNVFYLGVFKSKINAALARLTFEIECDKWHCDDRSCLVMFIKSECPKFNDKCLQ